MSLELRRRLMSARGLGMSNKEIWYTTSDNTPATLYSNSTYISKVKSHSSSHNKDGYFVIKLTEEITETTDLLRDNTNLLATKYPSSVKTISANAYYNCYSTFKTGASSLYIQEGIEKIMANAFYNGQFIVTMHFPSTLMQIDITAFDKTTRLSNLVLSEANTYLTLQDGVLYSKDENRNNIISFVPSSLNTNPTILDGVLQLPASCFKNRSITGITLNEQLETIGNECFWQTTKLTSISIPNSVKSIGSQCFRLSRLQSIHIGSGANITSNFLIEAAYVNEIVVDQSNQYIDSRDNCNAIIRTSTNTLISGCQSTVIPNSVNIIGADAFLGTSSLKKIIIPDSITQIDGRAFSGCTSLNTVVLGSGVVSLGHMCFYNCKAISSFTCKATTPPTIINTNALTSIPVDVALYVPAGSIDLYKDATGWSRFTNIQAIQE